MRCRTSMLAICYTEAITFSGTMTVHGSLHVSPVRDGTVWETSMLTIILIVLVVLLLFGGGGFYVRGRR